MPTPPVLQYPTNVAPVAVLAAARIGGVDVKMMPEKEWLNASPPTLTFESGAKLSGVPSLLRYIARSSPASVGLYGTDILTSTLVHILPSALCFANLRPLAAVVDSVVDSPGCPAIAFAFLLLSFLFSARTQIDQPVLYQQTLWRRLITGLIRPQQW